MHLQTAVLLRAEPQTTATRDMTEPFALGAITVDTLYCKRMLREEFEETESAEDKQNSIATIFCLFSSKETKKSHLKGKGDEEQTKQRGRATKAADQPSQPQHNARLYSNLLLYLLRRTPVRNWTRWGLCPQWPASCTSQWLVTSCPTTGKKVSVDTPETEQGKNIRPVCSAGPQKRSSANSAKAEHQLPGPEGSLT